jgi:hypothetical protein
MPDLSVLNKVMAISPQIMFRTKISCHKFRLTETFGIIAKWFSYPLQDFCYFSMVVWGILFSVMPTIRMVFLHVFAIIPKEFKILNSVVGLNSVYMMDSFFFRKFSPKRLFHNVSVLKHSLSIYIYSHVSKGGKTRSPFFEIRPFWRNIITFVPMPPISMHPTYLPVIPFQNFYATLNSADFSRCHGTNHNEKERTFQWPI